MGSLKTTLVKSFDGIDDSLDILVNKWLDNHNYCRIVDIKFAIDRIDTREALIIYYEDSDSYYNKNNELDLGKVNKDLALGKLTWVDDKLQRS